MSDDFSVAVCLAVEAMPFGDLATVVDLSVVYESDVGVGVEPYRLHPSRRVDHLQSMAAQAGVGETGDGFDTERVGAAVRDLVAGRTEHLDILTGSEESPDTAHLADQLVQGHRIQCKEAVHLATKQP